MNTSKILLAALLLVAIYTARANSKQITFNRQFVGVAFSPYTDHANNGQKKRPWDQYTINDIMTKLKTVKTRFSQISTYSMGVNDNPLCKQTWDKCDSNALIARAAARVNKDNPNNKLSVNIGTFQTKDLLQVEIDNAIKAAEDANKIFPGTVWGITVTNEYVTDPKTGNEVLRMINYAKSKTTLKIGARVHTCEQMDEGGPVQESLKSIAKASDFIYCNHYPSKGASDPSSAAEDVGSRFKKARNAFKGIKNSLDVRIGETGWPSDQNFKNFNETPNSKQLLVNYWEAMNNWATREKVQVQMFEAIDEPWKGDDSREGWLAQSYYGWWNKPNNNNDKLQEKQ